MKLRCASWRAVSSKPQVEKVSLSAQHAANQSKISELGGDCVAVLTVPGQSRDIVLFEEACATIEAYAQLRDLVVNHKIDLLVYYTKSRLGRTIALCETVVAFCWQHDVAVYDLAAPPSTLDPQEQRSSAGDTLTSAFMSWRSQNEVSELKDRHRKGMIDRIKSGNMANLLPWGYVKQYDQAGNWQVVIDEDKALAIRKAFDLYLQGLGTREVAQVMNEQGYTDGKGEMWTRGTVQGLLIRVRIYGGFVEVNRRSTKRPLTIAKGNHPAIISEDTMQRVLAEQKSRVAARRAVGSPYLFSRLVQCGICGHNLTVDASRLEFPSLRCAYCGRQVSERIVRKALDNWIEHIDQVGDMEITDLPEASGLEQIMAQFERQLADNNRAKERANTAYTDGVMDYTAYKAQLKRLDAKRNQLVEELEQVRQQIKHRRQREETIEQLASLAGIYAEMMNHPDKVAVNAWLRSFLRITFEADRSISVALL